MAESVERNRADLATHCAGMSSAQAANARNFTISERYGSVMVDDAW